MKALFVSIAIAVVLVSAGPMAWAASRIHAQQVKFKKGESAATLKGSIKGYQIIDYTLRARAGQSMKVRLHTDNLSSYFNVLPPGSETALFVGATSGDEWIGTLTADGEHTVRVYLMRSAARRNEAANFTLTVGIAGNPPPRTAWGRPRANDAKVPGTPYHATGSVPCAMGDAPKTQCDVGVIRSIPGNTEVHVTPPGGFKRVLTFVGDKVSANSDAKVKATKSGDMWSVDVNDYEHYQIPEAVIDGG